VVVASAGPYASLHLAPDRQPSQHPTARVFQAGCPSCRPTNSVKALKATTTPGNLLEFEIAPRNTEISWNLVDVPGNVIFARQAIFSTLYAGKSLGKQDHYDLRGYCMACHVKIFRNFLKMYPEYLLEISWKLVRLEF